MAFLRGVETAFAVAVLVDLIKAAVPSTMHAFVKLCLVLVLASIGAVVITPPPSAGGHWRDVVAAAFVGMGLAPLIHEMHSVLATFVDTNIRKVVSRARAAAAPQRRSSREMPRL
jgi:hypothetical protein